MRVNITNLVVAEGREVPVVGEHAEVVRLLDRVQEGRDLRKVLALAEGDTVLTVKGEAPRGNRRLGETRGGETGRNRRRLLVKGRRREAHAGTQDAKVEEVLLGKVVRVGRRRELVDDEHGHDRVVEREDGREVGGRSRGAARTRDRRREEVLLVLERQQLVHLGRDEVTLKLVEEDHANSERDVVDLAVVAGRPARPRLAGDGARAVRDRGHVGGRAADDAVDDLREGVELHLDANAVRRESDDGQVHLGVLKEEEVQSDVPRDWGE